MSLTPNGLIMLQKSAKNGNQYAQFDLAVMYANGDCVSKDETKAAEWYEKAAIQGNKFAQFNLGVLHEFGRGVPKDETIAAEWYQKAAAQGWSMEVDRKSASNKENPIRYNKPHSNETPSGKGALISVVATLTTGLVFAFIGKNYNSEFLTFINVALVIGSVYALIKHTHATLAIILLVVIITVAGSVVKGCSSQSNHVYEPGPGFR